MNDFLERFINIGFTLKESRETTIGIIKEYKYYPERLGDKHFTLITFKYIGGINNSELEFRLYIHKNSDGAFHDSLFQRTYSKDLDLEFDKIFAPEMRDSKLVDLLD